MGESAGPWCSGAGGVRMQFRPVSALRGLLIAVIVCSGCHRPEPVTAPRLSIWDNAELLTETHRQRLRGLEPLLASSGTHLAVLTVNTIPGREPGRFADRAFESFPSYSAVVKPAVKPSKAVRRQNARVAEAWRPRMRGGSRDANSAFASRRWALHSRRTQ